MVEGVVLVIPLVGVPAEPQESGTDGAVQGDAAVLYPTTDPSTDTVLRPVYDGLMSFQVIRDQASPTEFSWEVELEPTQTLKLIDSKNAGVYFVDGTQMVAISAQSARGADGTAVDTSLSISEGNVLTLTVHHKVAGIVYPVTAGTGFHVGYSTVTVTPPGEPSNKGDMVLLPVVVSPPIAEGFDGEDGEATISGAQAYTRKWAVPACNRGILGFLDCDAWEQRMRGFFRYNFKVAWYKPNRQPQCHKERAIIYDIDQISCEWLGPNFQKFNLPSEWFPKPNTHITAQTRFYVIYEPVIAAESWYRAVTVGGWGNGHVSAWRNDKPCNPYTPSCGGETIP